MSLRNATCNPEIPSRAEAAMVNRGLPQIWRIVALNSLLVVMLGGCATYEKVKTWLSPDVKSRPVAHQPVGPPAPPPVAAQPKPKRPPVREAHETKAPEIVASIDPNSLVGLDPPAVERLLGAPTNISKADPSLVWTYVTPDCSFQIFFYPDLKTSSFHALKYAGVGGNGGPIDASQPCIRSILTAKNNGPS